MHAEYVKNQGVGKGIRNVMLMQIQRETQEKDLFFKRTK